MRRNSIRSSIRIIEYCKKLRIKDGLDLYKPLDDGLVIKDIDKILYDYGLINNSTKTFKYRGYVCQLFLLIHIMRYSVYIYLVDKGKEKYVAIGRSFTGENTIQRFKRILEIPEESMQTTPEYDH